MKLFVLIFFLAVTALAQTKKDQWKEYFDSYKVLHDAYVSKFGHEVEPKDTSKIEYGIGQVMQGKKFEWTRENNIVVLKIK